MVMDLHKYLLTHGGGYDCYIKQILADAEMTKLISSFKKSTKVINLFYTK